MPQKVIPHFIDGLNTVQHPTQIKDTECQSIGDMDIKPINTIGSDGNGYAEYLALTARSTFLKLHTDQLPFTPQNLIEFQSVFVPSGFYGYVNDYQNTLTRNATYLYTTTTANPLVLGFTFPNLPIPGTDVINSIQVQMVFRGHSSSGGTARIGIKVNGTVYYASATSPGSIDGSWVPTSFTFTTNPDSSANWVPADINGTGSHNLTAMAVKLDSGAGIDVSAINILVHYTQTVQPLLQTANPTSDVTTATWTQASNFGQRSLVTGGFNFTTGNFELRKLQDQTTTTSLIKAQSSKSTGICNLVLSNQYLYYNDGNVVARKWDGTTEKTLAATDEDPTTPTPTFTYVVKAMEIHQGVMFYGNDITNSIPNILYFSDVGNPDAVNPSNFYLIGSASEAIIGLQSQGQRLIVFKQNSTWVIDMAVDFANSDVYNYDVFKGIAGPNQILYCSSGVFAVCTGFGLQKMPPSVSSYYRTYFEPAAPQILNLLRVNMVDPMCNMGINYDQLYLSCFMTESLDGTNPRVFTYDLLANKVSRYLMYISCFCKNRGVLTFNNALKACLGTGYIVEFDHILDGTETVVPATFQTKDFTFDLPDHKKTINYIIFEGIAADNTSTLALNVVTDDNSLDQQQVVPAGPGWFRWYQPFTRDGLRTGNKFSFIFSYPQLQTATRFAALSLTIDYDVEPRVE